MLFIFAKIPWWLNLPRSISFTAVFVATLHRKETSSVSPFWPIMFMFMFMSMHLVFLSVELLQKCLRLSHLGFHFHICKEHAMHIQNSDMNHFYEEKCCFSLLTQCQESVPRWWPGCFHYVLWPSCISRGHQSSDRLQSALRWNLQTLPEFSHIRIRDCSLIHHRDPLCGHQVAATQEKLHEPLTLKWTAVCWLPYNKTTH